VGQVMESSIIRLDERTDQATRKMLQKVVERKEKYDRLASRHLIVMWSAILISFFYFIYLYYYLFQPYSYSFSAIFSSYVNQTSNLYLLIFIIGLYGYMNLIRGKRDKAEKEFHALRCEIIDKSKDLWKKEDEWKNRHIVFEMMKENFDINLFHENK
jgi:Protein of unknown function (DUF2663)